MGALYVAGVDPGLRDTGIVRYRWVMDNNLIEVRPIVVSGGKAEDVIRALATAMGPKDPVFIEAYRPRGGMNTNARMMALVRDIQQGYNHGGIRSAKVLPNTGIKSVVKPQLLSLLQSASFGIRTNHDDLVSAARIAILGMLKDDAWNARLTQLVTDTIEGVDWDIRQLP